MNRQSQSRQDIYTRVTAAIIADLEQGVRPWVKPWDAEHAAGRITRPLRHNGQPYSGINILMLWAQSVSEGFAAPIWMTYRQAQELGAQVRKGEKGSLVVYANSITRTEQDDCGEELEKEIHFMKGYTVFNVEQIDSLPDHYYAKPAPKFENAPERIAHAETFFTNIRADIRHRGTQAFYSQSGDYIQLPPIEAFRDAESYYATLAHESAHWTKHPSRLDRDFAPASGADGRPVKRQWGDENYAREELVGELASAFLSADLEITPETREDHASYIEHWLTVLKSDKRAIFSAAAHAQRATDYLHSLQAKPEVQQADRGTAAPGSEQ